MVITGGLLTSAKGGRPIVSHADDGPGRVEAPSRAHALGYALGIKNTYTMNVEFYTGVDERLEVPRILPPAPDFVDLQHAKVLIADDVADTGKTLESVQEFVAGKVGEVRTAVIYEKPHSIVRCDYVWKRTDRWINFPWSTEPPVVRSATTVLDA
jgi:hypoxanthine phosphoribosyltransferase